MIFPERPNLRAQIEALPTFEAEYHSGDREPGTLISDCVRKSDVLALLPVERETPEPQWLSIADVEPPDNEYCLVWRKWPGKIRVYKCELRQLPRVTWEGLYGWEPTHWMPLPPPPDERSR